MHVLMYFIKFKLLLEREIIKLALVDGKVSDPWVGEMPWRRKWLPSPVFWPGEFHGLYSPWGRRVRHN